MAKMVPRIVKRAGTFNRHLRVNVFTLNSIDAEANAAAVSHARSVPGLLVSIFHAGRFIVISSGLNKI